MKKHPWITAALGAALALLLAAVLIYSRQIIQQQAMDDAVKSLQQVMERTDRHLHQIEAAADSLIPKIEQHIDQPDMMFAYSRELLKQHPDLKGCSISFDPYFYKEKGQYFSAYSYKKGNRIVTEQEGNDNYQYFYMDWYVIPRMLYHSYWIEPFAEKSTSGIVVNDIMTSYCQPIQSGPDKTVGILSADVPLSWLADQIENYQPIPKSYCMLLGRGGSYIVHPDSTRLLYETIFTSTIEHPDTALTSLGRAMTDGETGYKSLRLDGVDSHVFYMPFRQTGWSIALVCPNEVILSNYRLLLYFLLPLILLSIMLMFMPLWRLLFRRRHFAAVLLPLLVLTATSCHNNQPNKQEASDQPSPEEKASDKIREQLDAYEGNRWFQVLDSLEQAGKIATCQADFMRGEKYEEMEQPRSALIFYSKAIEGNKLLQISKDNFYDAYMGVCIGYLNNNNVELALKTATEGYEIASKDSSIVGRDMSNNLQLEIGMCQLRLGYNKEAAETFEEVRQGALQLAQSYPQSPDCQESCILISSNIINYYMNQKKFDLVEPWLDMMETALERYAATNAPTETYSDHLATLNCDKAIMWSMIGHHEEAEAAYQSFLSSNYAHKLRGIYDQAFYLETTEQWEKLLSIALRIDSAEIAAEVPPTLDYLIASPSTLFKAMVKTGRKEEALQKAEHIVQMLDSVKAYQHRSDAEELAVIYETEQKEQEIAAQRASLNSQRMQAIVVVVLLLLIFLGVLFEFYRKLRRAHTLLEISYNNLVIANERAEESSKMKTNFIRQISHEIRTPLNILSGFTQIITMPDMKFDEATRTDINHKIVENTDRITGLVNKMLELSDASSQAVIDRTDNVLAVQIAAQATDASEVANAKHLKFDLQVGDAEGAVTITTNEQAATRALTMLLDNARKFTRPAEAKNEKQTEQQQVTLTLKKTESTIEFIVEDTGVGVPLSEAEHVFDEFVQLDEYYEGTGIGLTVARSLARRLGGDVVLDTTYTSGARFVMTLPLA
ncbi:Cache domain-containing protein [Xylanibacter ruminicola]|uniref:histidine kinase n=1 Tax=Xylanibacter ruminicola TaxID=839 RepID=A0A1M7I8W8_XYLRU|nr:ATP-binding protein [Xylanibacter ruminicola]SFB77780.1 Cache domain-containing protein [Xylanibacter ruminicola]SHM37089.1 Cache domain-containing protein [Xylanibacter ruminicola]